jgi:hypothetical protein
MELTIDLWGSDLVKSVRLGYVDQELIVDIGTLRPKGGSYEPETVIERKIGGEHFWNLYENYFEHHPIESDSESDTFTKRNTHNLPQTLFDALRSENSTMLDETMFKFITRPIKKGIVISTIMDINGFKLRMSDHFVYAKGQDWISSNIDPREIFSKERFGESELRLQWIKKFKIDQLIVQKMIDMAEG